MKLFRSGDEDGLILESWFIFWVSGACLGGYLVWHWAGVLLTFCLIHGIRAERRL